MTSAKCVAKGASSFLSHRSRVRDFGWSSLLVGGGGGTRRRASVVPGIISASALTEKQRKGMEEVVQRTHRGTAASTSSPLLFRQILLSIMQRSSWKKEFRRENEPACSHSCQFALFLSRAVTTHRETIARAVLYMETVLSPFSACLIKPLTKTTFRFSSFFLLFWLPPFWLRVCYPASRVGGYF